MKGNFGHREAYKHRTFGKVILPQAKELTEAGGEAKPMLP
jgi:hypothetical protein